MTQQERDELRAAEAKMTPGEWETIENVRASGDCLWNRNIGDVAKGMETRDARGIALIRNRIVALLDHADQAEKVIRRLIDHCNQASSDGSFEAVCRLFEDAERLIGGGA
jgi:hypothetical protein